MSDRPTGMDIMIKVFWGFVFFSTPFILFTLWLFWYVFIIPIFEIRHDQAPDDILISFPIAFTNGGFFGPPCLGAVYRIREDNGFSKADTTVRAHLGYDSKVPEDRIKDDTGWLDLKTNHHLDYFSRPERKLFERPCVKHGIGRALYKWRDEGGAFYRVINYGPEEYAWWVYAPKRKRIAMSYYHD